MAEDEAHPDNYCVHLILTRDWSEDTMAAKGLFPKDPVDVAIRKLVEDEFKAVVINNELGGEVVVDKIVLPVMDEVDSPNTTEAAANLLGMCREVLLSCHINDAKVRENAWQNLLGLFSQFPKLVSRVGLRVGGKTVHISAEAYEQARDAMLSQKKIEAIKIIRAASELGLKEAKDLVEDPTNFKQYQ